MSELYSVQTNLLHNKTKFDEANGAVSVPIQYASTFHQSDFDQYGIFDYSRSGNPTRAALEETIAELDGGTRAFAFASGMAAISTALLLFSKGDHIIVTEDVYGGTFRFVNEVLTRFGIDHTFVDLTEIERVEAAIRPNTVAIYIETPSNPLLRVTDIKGIVELAQSRNCLTLLDNTFLTPILQRPLDLGVDIVLYSATKFLSGHSDCLSGLAVVKDEGLGERLAFLQNSFGAVLGAEAAWLLLRGLKTLFVRLEKSSQSALEIAEYFKNHPLVEEVYYPGLVGAQGYAIQKKQASGSGAVLSFRLKNEAAARAFVNQVQLPIFAVSLGGVESILSYPAKMSHAAMPKEERLKRGITDGLLRLSVGLEHADDLIGDFEQSLQQVEQGVGAHSEAH